MNRIEQLTLLREVRDGLRRRMETGYGTGENAARLATVEKRIGDLALEELDAAGVGPFETV